jgi:hypothetical protein
MTPVDKDSIPGVMYESFEVADDMEVRGLCRGGEELLPLSSILVELLHVVTMGGMERE